MSLSVNCAAAYGTIGSLCGLVNTLRMINGLAITVPTFSFATTEEFADKTIWDDGIKAKEVFILKNVQEIDDAGEEVKYYTAATGRKTKMQDSVYGFLYRFLLSLQVHKELQKFNGQELRYFKFDTANNILGYIDPADDLIKGFTLSDFSTENMVIPTTNETPAFSPLMVTEADRNEFNLHGWYVNPLWLTSSLKSLAPVIITITNPLATGFDMHVGYTAGLNRDGTINSIGILGLVTADFVCLDAAGVVQAITVVEGAEGNYTASGAGLVTGTVALVDPSVLSAGLLITTPDDAILTI